MLATFHDPTFMQHAYFICFLMVESRCATTRVVRFSSNSPGLLHHFSDSVSKAEVASSKIKIGGFSRLPGMLMLPLPPDLLPYHLYSTHNHVGRHNKIMGIGNFAASTTCSMVASSTPKAILLKKESLKRKASWFTCPSAFGYRGYVSS